MGDKLSIPFLRLVIMDLKEHGNMEQAENLLKGLFLKEIEEKESGNNEKGNHGKGRV